MSRVGRWERPFWGLLAAAVALGAGAWAGCDTSDNVGGRAFKYQDRLYDVSCLRVDVDVLGRRIGPVPFEEGRLVIAEVEDVDAANALAAQFDECHFKGGGEEWVLGIGPGANPADFTHLVAETESGFADN